MDDTNNVAPFKYFDYDMIRNITHEAEKIPFARRPHKQIPKYTRNEVFKRILWQAERGQFELELSTITPHRTAPVITWETYQELDALEFYLLPEIDNETDLYMQNIILIRWVE